MLFIYENINNFMQRRFQHKMFRSVYTQRNLSEVLSSQTVIILYIPFSDWFGTANGHCPLGAPNQSENGKYNLISVWFNKI